MRSFRRKAETEQADFASTKGGEADADYITYRALYGHDCRKTQKPPPWPVTVSMPK